VAVVAAALRRPRAVVRVLAPQLLRVGRHRPPVPRLAVAQLPQLLARQPVAPGMPAVEPQAEAGRPAAAAGAVGGRRLRRSAPPR
jgi:hypothetical protein